MKKYVVQYRYKQLSGSLETQLGGTHQIIANSNDEAIQGCWKKIDEYSTITMLDKNEQIVNINEIVKIVDQ